MEEIKTLAQEYATKLLKESNLYYLEQPEQSRENVKMVIALYSCGLLSDSDKTLFPKEK